MELLDICKEDGLPTGKTVSRDIAHRDGILHRTAHVWIVRKKENGYDILLQKRSMEKESFPGLYDTSSTGQTVFIEPMAVVETNNKIKELQLREDAEIERICHVFTTRIADNKGQISADIEVLATLDFACAKAELGLSMEGTVAGLAGSGDPSSDHQSLEGAIR